MNPRRQAVVWAYTCEVILAMLLVTLLLLTCGKKLLIDLAQQSAIDFATLYCAVFSAGALGFLWTLYSKTDSKFYVWLDRQRAFNVFAHATVYTLFVEGGATLLLIFTKYIKSEELAIFACAIFIRAFINSITMILNVVGLMKLKLLYTRFDQDS